jgi:bifunctional non-homologous end joining protein LigD
MKEPSFIVPMKAKPIQELPKGTDWIYELKFDGFRFLATKGGDAVHLWSRTEREMSARFPSIAQAIRELPCETAILDGELVVTDERGVPSFQLIQNADERTTVQAFVFDLLHLDGDDLQSMPLDERRQRLATLISDRALLHFSSALKGTAEAVLAMVKERGLEGIIAKRRSSVYEPDRRSGAWVKVKCSLEQEFVIGGFTAPKGARSHFGALLVGYFSGNELIFAGRVGTGFDQKMLTSLHRQMRNRRIEANPFAALPNGRSRWGAGLTRAELASCTWTKPELVAQVRFEEWTVDGLLRQPAFLGLREDKDARDVTRET